MTDAEVYNYKWIVLLCGLLVNFMVWGNLHVVGLLFVRWNEHFTDSAKVAFVGGLATGIGQLLGPVIGVFVERHGFRKCGFAGALFISVGMITSSFSTSLLLLGLLYAVLAGTGAGVCTITSSVALNFFFVKKRALAEGIMSMGSGLGTLIFSQLYQYLMDAYGWRGTLLIAGGFSLHLVVLHQLMLSPHYMIRFPMLASWRTAEDNNTYPKQESELATNHFTTTSRRIISSADNDQKTDEPLKTKDKNKKSFVRGSILLFKNPVFHLLFVCNLLCWLCISIPTFHLGERCKIEGIDDKITSTIYSMIGLCGIVGRPVIASVPTFFKIQPLKVYAVVQISVGLATILSPYFSNVEGSFVYAAILGLSKSYIPLIKTSLAILLGNDIFPIAFSWLLLSEGIGLCLGPTIAGLVLCGVLACFQPLATRLRRRLER